MMIFMILVVVSIRIRVLEDVATLCCMFKGKESFARDFVGYDTTEVDISQRHLLPCEQ